MPLGHIYIKSPHIFQETAPAGGFKKPPHRRFFIQTLETRPDVQSLRSGHMSGPPVLADACTAGRDLRTPADNAFDCRYLTVEDRPATDLPKEKYCRKEVIQEQLPLPLPCSCFPLGSPKAWTISSSSSCFE